MANSWYLDITTCKIKYEEGFANMLGHIYTKPEPMWTKADQALVIPTGKDGSLQQYTMLAIKALTQENDVINRIQYLSRILYANVSLEWRGV